MNLLLRNIKIKTYLVALISISFLCFISCDFILSKNEENSIKNKIVKTYKDEAKLLVKASINNLDIIKLSKSLTKETTLKSVDHLAIKLEKSHLEILESYNKIANDKLISVPNYSNLKLEESTESISSRLRLIISKINKQIDLLNNLKTTSRNEDILELTDNVQSILKTNKIKTENVLNHLII